MADWEIKKPIGRCCATGREFAPEEDYYAALVETPDGLERRDFSREYWEANRPQVFCFWKTRMPNPQKKKQQLFVDPEMLLAFFDRLASETEPEKLNFRFVLMLILLRKKRLKYEGSRTHEGREIWTLRVVGQDRTVDVLNPNLTDEQIQQLSQQMGQILQTELD